LKSISITITFNYFQKSNSLQSIAITDCNYPIPGAVIEYCMVVCFKFSSRIYSGNLCIYSVVPQILKLVSNWFQYFADRCKLFNEKFPF